MVSAMAPLYVLHPENPQQRRVQTLVKDLQRGAVILYPTDTVYAIGCDLQAKAAVQRVRQIKQLSNDKPLTFLCQSLSQAAQYAQIDDERYSWLRSLIPGPYTLLLPATKRVPAWVMASKSRTVGIRIPQHPVCQALIEALGNPLLSTSAHSPAANNDLTDANSGASFPAFPPDTDQFDTLEPLVDAIVAETESYPRILGEGSDYLCSTILDLNEMPPRIIRRGLGMEAIAHWDLPEDQTADAAPRSRPASSKISQFPSSSQSSKPSSRPYPSLTAPRP
jgi:tRNA threonylcarbamoyl adenosine modification protein (Sua5/YciO/YrdC/YwlC family)